MVYEIKCSWCGEHIGTKEGESNTFTQELQSRGLPIISHGICPRCREKALEDANINREGENHD